MLEVLVLREGDTVARGVRGDDHRRSILILGRRRGECLGSQLERLGVALLLGRDQTRKGRHGEGGGQGDGW